LGNDNSYHDDTSLYSISPLYNSKTVENGLLFEKGAIWLIRTPSLNVFKDFYLRGKNSIGSELGYGLILKNITFTVEKFTDITELTIGTSPIFLGQNPNVETPDHITYKHDSVLVSNTIKRILFTKAEKMGYSLKEDDIQISFNANHPLKTKSVKLGKAVNITTSGKIDITGTPEAIGLCYGLGIGKSTGCGFGFMFNIK
jgi:CRISPR-associated endoribonuclease Cas6